MHVIPVCLIVQTCGWSWPSYLSAQPLVVPAGCCPCHLLALPDTMERTQSEQEARIKQTQLQLLANHRDRRRLSVVQQFSASKLATQLELNESRRASTNLLNRWRRIGTNERRTTPTGRPSEQVSVWLRAATGRQTEKTRTQQGHCKATTKAARLNCEIPI